MPFLTKLRTASLLSVPFRVFFLLTSLMGIIIPILWISIFLGSNEYVGLLLAPLQWHIHEMLFGFTGAVIAGFILTASANWSSRPPFKGPTIAILGLLWLVERIALYLPIMPLPALLMSLPFSMMLTVLVYLQLQHTRKQLYVFLPVIGALFLAKVLFLTACYLKNDVLLFNAKYLSMGLIKFLIVLLTGRVIPFFTNSKLGPNLQIAIPPFLQAATVISVLLLALPLPFLQFGYMHVAFLAVAIFLMVGRTAYCRPFKSAKEPMLLILNIGTMWMIVHFILELVSIFLPEASQFQAPVHAFGAGAVGVTVLGMMTRVALGHTGRKIQADYAIWIVFICVNLGALCRVFLPFVLKDYSLALHLASWIWGGAFFVYFLRYFKILIGARPDRINP